MHRDGCQELRVLLSRLHICWHLLERITSQVVPPFQEGSQPGLPADRTIHLLMNVQGLDKTAQHTYCSRLNISFLK